MTPHPDDRVIMIASTPVITLQRQGTLREAAQRLRAADVGALVVPPDGSHPMAVVSERDVVRALADGADPDEVRAADVMTEEPRYATPGQSIRSVGAEMLATGVRHVPLLDEGEIVGMVAARDVLAVMAAAVPHRPGAARAPHEAQAVDRELAHPGG